MPKNNIKVVYKSKIIFFIILIMLTFSGCVGDQVEISLSPISTDLNKASFNVSYSSSYSDPQNVTIDITTNDPRLGLSTSELDGFKQSVILDEEVGSRYTNSKRIYVKVIDSSIPSGDYKISAIIEGEKSKKTYRYTQLGEIIVKLEKGQIV